MAANIVSPIAKFIKLIFFYSCGFSIDIPAENFLYCVIFF